MNPHIPHHKVVMVLLPCPFHAPQLYLSKVSIMVLCLLCSPCYTAVRIKNYSKSTSVIKVATMKIQMALHAPVIWNWSIHCPSLSATFDSLYSSTNQELFEKHLCSQGSHYEKYGQFPLHKGSHHMQPPKQYFSLSAKMNGTQKWILVSPWRMHCTYCGMPKDTSRAKATSNSEKIKP